MATKKWFVRKGDEELGPLGPNGLRKLVRRGEVTEDTMVRREDHAAAVPAGQLRGLFPANDYPDVSAGPAQRARQPFHPQVHGPYTALGWLGWTTAALLLGFAVLGVWGAALAWQQVQQPEGAIAAPLLGVGVFAPLGLVLVGALFLFWQWTARINLPHLIHARTMHAPSWTFLAWLIPVVNLQRPYEVLREIDRLSAEADADGDATVGANTALLLPWWIAALLGTVLAVVYLLLAKDTAADLAVAAWCHLGAGVCATVAAVLAMVLVLRITIKQERAHSRHPEPVQVHHKLSGRRAALAQH